MGLRPDSKNGSSAMGSFCLTHGGLGIATGDRVDEKKFSSLKHEFLDKTKRNMYAF